MLNMLKLVSFLKLVLMYLNVWCNGKKFIKSTDKFPLMWASATVVVYFGIR
jgi:hypothetical protein